MEETVDKARNQLWYYRDSITVGYVLYLQKYITIEVTSVIQWCQGLPTEAGMLQTQ